MFKWCFQAFFSTTCRMTCLVGLFGLVGLVVILTPIFDFKVLVAQFITTWWVVLPEYAPLNIPVFPGAYSFLSVLVFNMIVAAFTRQFGRVIWGVRICVFGCMFVIFGGILMSVYSETYRLVIEKGKSSQYWESTTAFELE